MPAKTKISGFDSVREIGRTFPNVEEGTAYGSPALKLRGQMFACLTTNKAAEPNTLAVRVSIADREALLAADPRVFYIKPHYENHPVVLVRLGEVTRDGLRELLQMGIDFVGAKRRG